MKNTLTILLILSIFTSCIYANERIELKPQNNNNLISTQVNDVDIPINYEVLDLTINEDFSCTRSIKVYIPTEAGIIGIGLSITASTCAAADAGISSAIYGFMKEL